MKLSILKINKGVMKETIYYKVLLPFYDEKCAMVKTVGNLDFHDDIKSWKIKKS